jgi:ABC-type uncharacterized transport system permease subunit
MTAVTRDGAAVTLVDAPAAAPSLAERLDRLTGAARILAAFAAALVLFAIVMLLKGVNPITAYVEMATSTFSGTDAIGDILVRATPIVLAGLAVSVPARAGLINVGGEGQLIIGGICAFGTSMLVDGRLAGGVTLLLMIVGAALGGAAWSALAALLRQLVGISE